MFKKWITTSRINDYIDGIERLHIYLDDKEKIERSKIGSIQSQLLDDFYIDNGCQNERNGTGCYSTK